MRSPYCIGVFLKSLPDATRFISAHCLGDNVIQFIPEDSGVWVMLRVTGDQSDAIVESPDTQKVI